MIFKRLIFKVSTDKLDQLILTNSTFSMDFWCNDVLHPAEVSGRPHFSVRQKNQVLKKLDRKKTKNTNLTFDLLMLLSRKSNQIEDFTADLNGISAVQLSIQLNFIYHSL